MRLPRLERISTSWNAFAFNSTPLHLAKKKQWPVAFVIDPKLSKDVGTITLSYTFFEVGGRTPAAPQATNSAVDKAAGV